MLPVKIAGLGVYLPACIVASADLEQSLSLPSGWIERVTGVSERRFATDETSAGMAAAAACEALAMAGLTVSDLDAIVGASTGPQQAIPCTAVFVQHALGAPDGGSACFDINATCLSFLFALQTAAHLVAAGAYRTLLLYSSEITSRSLNAKEPESSVLFGDAACAAVITGAPDGESAAVHHSRFVTYSSGAEFTQLVGCGTLHHPNAAETTPEMNMFHMDGPAVFKKASRLVGPFLDDFFAELGCERSTISCVVPHQASRHGVELLITRLGFTREQIFTNLATRGNCIAASIPLGLAEAVQTGRIKRGDKVLLVGTGAGLTIGAISLTF